MKRIAPWLSLKSVPGIGNLLFARLMDRFGSPETVFSATANQLQQVKGVSDRLAGTIAGYRTPDAVLKEIDRAGQKGFKIITMADDRYPDLLRHIPDPPPVLYLYGTLENMVCPIAIVGSRRATQYGLDATRRLCIELAQAGAHVVSGMAAGIDTAAHWGAIAGGGKTVAVLGSGLNHIYPPGNAKLYHEIARNGCVLSEFPLDAAPEAHHFPMRNRIISGMSLGTVVVEAARKSGSLITARLSAEQNREVFAVPGNIHAATAKGTHDLIKQGAKLVENAADILEEVAPQLVGRDKPQQECKPLPTLTPDEDTLFGKIEAYPVHIDVLTRRLNTDAGRLSALLTQLEIKGLIRQEPGKNFVRHPDYTDDGVIKT